MIIHRVAEHVKDVKHLAHNRYVLSPLVRDIHQNCRIVVDREIGEHILIIVFNHLKEYYENRHK